MSERTAEQRAMAVAIARDVIEQLDAGQPAIRITSRNGYLNGRLDFAIPRGDEMSLHVDLLQKQCTVCMLGACLLSKARLYDEIPLADFLVSDSSLVVSSGRGDMLRNLNDIFGRQQLDMLESAFGMFPRFNDDFFRGAAQFGRNFCDDRDRARAIMKNVIANDGEFVVKPISQLDYEVALDI